jgi:hypothetical protein
LPHTLSKNYVHVIFRTKDRHKIIEKELQPRLWAYPFSTGLKVIHIVPLLTAVYFGDNLAYDYRTRIN